MHGALLPMLAEQGCFIRLQVLCTLQRGKGKKSKEKAAQSGAQKIEMVKSSLPPPPGFTTISASTIAAPLGAAESSSRKPRQQKKGTQSKEAAPAEVQPLFSKQGAHAEGGSNVTCKPALKLK